MSNWRKVEIEAIASLAKQKFNPKKTVNKICVELEHITKETGRLIGSTSSKMQLSTKNVFHKGNVLFGKLRPNLRKYLYCDFHGVCSSEIWVLVPKQNVYPKFLFFLVQSEKFVSAACVISGSRMPRADWNYVSKIPFSLPPLSEQRAIANGLDTWNAAIEKTERLIAVKERQFKWLLKRLISDQQNNPRWHKMKLGNLCAKILGGGTPSTANVSYWKGHIPWMTSADIVNAKTINARKYITDQAVTDSATNLIPRNNIIVVTRVGLGKAVKNEMDICISQDSQGLILKKSVSADFLIHCLLEKIKVFKSASQGSTIQGIIKKRLFDIEVSLPSLPQQKQIAQQLDIVEQEIGLLKQLTEKYCAQKRGLMQKLLTGEWRVKSQ